MKKMTIRNNPFNRAESIEADKCRRGQSLRRKVLELMRAALGVSTGRRHSILLGFTLGTEFSKRNGFNQLSLIV